jgi:hypothetical protein
MDLSLYDRKYFLDARRYNCPFCNRGSVAYSVVEVVGFNWSQGKRAYAYFVKCDERDCDKISMHLSYYFFETNEYYPRFNFAPHGTKRDEYSADNLDSYFFFHQPTTFFTIDERINLSLRNLVSEAENCLKMNLLVGASACVRKAIYELIDLENVRVENQNGRTNYQDSIKALKEKFKQVPPEYFDALANIQELASDKVHEGSWEAWDSQKLKALLELTKNILHEMYVVPDEQKKRAGVASKFLGDLKAAKAADKVIESEPSGKKIS